MFIALLIMTVIHPCGTLAGPDRSSRRKREERDKEEKWWKGETKLVAKEGRRARKLGF
jgi:hypothetical protein